jgi:hypothetical protein
MFLKLFQVFIITLLVVFSAALGMFLIAGVVTSFGPATGSSGITAFVGGLKIGLVELAVVVIVLTVSVVLLVSRRHRLK